jgi:hypothetical protein
MLNSRVPLDQALNIMDEKSDGGKLLPFSITWVAKDGSVMILDKAVKCGLRADVDRRKYIGVRSLTSTQHHPHMVHVRTIISFNKQRVYW